MPVDEFRKSLAAGKPPSGSGKPLQALWHDANGDWDRAHKTVQSEESAQGAWVHAYLHRKEGDLSNADYWYKRAKHKRPDGALEDELESIVAALLRAQG